MRKEAESFSGVSAQYERGRPGYPSDAVGFIVEQASLAPGRTVVDLAAGTGKLTRELVSSGAEVTAVEPLEAMRAQLELQLPTAKARAGTADATGLEAGIADAVTVAQAFHWFAEVPSLVEIARVLKADGLLFLVWNRRDPDDPLQARLGQMLEPYGRAYPSHRSGVWQGLMEATELFTAHAEFHTRYVQEVDRSGLVDRVGSISYVAALDEGARRAFLDEVGGLVGDTETTELPYLTEVFCYRKVAARPER